MNLDEFLRRVDLSDDCWRWLGARCGPGYGGVGAHSYAHRVSYELHIGPIPDGMTIDHICHNRMCVNPAHLRLATAAQQNANIGPKGGRRFKGVGFHRRANAWRAYIGVGGRSVHLGLFPTAEAAARAYNEAATRLHGQFAYLNAIGSEAGES